MKRTRAMVILCAALALPCLANAGVSLSTAPDQYPCRDQDMMGSFSLNSMTETPPSQEQAWYRDYKSQYYVFRSDHTYGFVASRHRFLKPEELQQSIAATMSYGMTQIVNKYTLDNTGLLSLYTNDRLDYTYRCAVITKVRGFAQPGDIELQGYSKQKTLLDKVLRRWPPQ